MRAFPICIFPNSISAGCGPFWISRARMPKARRCRNGSRSSYTPEKLEAWLAAQRPCRQPWRHFHRAHAQSASVVTRLTVAPGVMLWREKFSRAEQQTLLNDVQARLEIPRRSTGPACPDPTRNSRLRKAISVPWAGSRTRAAIAISKLTHPCHGHALAGNSTDVDGIVALYRARAGMRNAVWSISIGMARAWACIRIRMMVDFSAPVRLSLAGRRSFIPHRRRDAPARAHAKREAVPPAMW